MSTWWKSVVIASAMGALAAASGCNGASDRPPTIASQTVQASSSLTAPTCVAANVLAVHGIPSQSPNTHEPIHVPDNFEPTTVITCEPDWIGASETRSKTVMVIETHRTGDLSAVLDAYAQPTDRRDFTCLVDQALPPSVWLVDSAGLGMRPILPQNECGGFKGESILEIGKLPTSSEPIVHEIPFT